MIDLRFSDLPSAIVVDDEEYELNTSFRVWIEFERMFREDKLAWYGVFADPTARPPAPEWIEAAIEFLASPTTTPRTEKRAETRTLDYIEDGELITAAFQQAYGIDLTSQDLHWHRFKALLANIPDDTKLGKVMGYRSYTTPPKKRDIDGEMKKLRRIWELPDQEEEKLKQDILAWADANLPTW